MQFQKRPKLYHFKIYIPENLKTRYGTLSRLVYSNHAKQAALNDRYGKINCPISLNTDTAQVIEVEAEGNIVIKVVYRIPYSSQYDLCLAVIPRQSFVKTVWLNDKCDLHKTLDMSKYEKN